jgi:cobalt-zinc-cadmium efflux system outer membrane protein
MDHHVRILRVFNLMMLVLAFPLLARAQQNQPVERRLHALHRRTRVMRAMEDMSILSGTRMAAGSPGSATESAVNSYPQPKGKTLSLEELQRMAREANPTLGQAQMLIESAEGRRVQAGLYPNPSVGYNAENASPALNGGEQGAIFQQTIVTANKLGLAQNISAREKSESVEVAKVQALRVLNDVTMLYYSAVAARRIVELRGRFLQLAEQAVDITRRLVNVGQADKPDLLQSQVEANLALVALSEAANDEARAWRVLAATVGEPNLEPHPLTDVLDEPPPELDEKRTFNAILERSPEISLAQLGVRHAEAILARARVEPVPDINFIAGPWVNFERSRLSGAINGPAAVAEITVAIPVFDRNQGSIAAARADITRARDEVTRVKLELRARFAPVFASYLTNLTAVKRYKSEILAQTEQAYRLYLIRYQQMAAAYPQVLIAQRTMIQAQQGYIEALRNTWTAVVLLRGMLLSGGLQTPTRPPEVLTRPVSSQTEIVRSYIPGL